MTLLEILVNELENWPEGKEYAFQSSTSRMAFFASSPLDDDIKSVTLSQNPTDRGPHHRVRRDQWETAKIKSAPYFKDTAAVLGEERAIKELQAVGRINYEADELDEAFIFADTPQGHEFWRDILEPNRGADKLKQALNVITAAMLEANPDYCIRLQNDGSGSVRDQDDNEIIYFHNTDSLVKKYLAPTPKFEHWGLLQERFNWIAKDSDDGWWAYENKPDLGHDQWKYSGECHSLDILKVEIPCHWSKSLIKRPTP